jgi:hypothetical protein
MPLGHRIAYDLRLVNVSPYSFMEAMVTRKQLQTLIDAMRREHARKLFLPAGILPAQYQAALVETGFVPRSQQLSIGEWIDAVGG